MKRILIWGLLFFSTPVLAQQKEYPSFTRFIDSVFRAVNVKVVDININKGKGKRDALFAAGGYWARNIIPTEKYATVQQLLLRWRLSLLLTVTEAVVHITGTR